MQFDFHKPDYEAVYAERVRKLTWIRANPAELPALKHHYGHHPADFINDFGMTYDPRLATERRAIMPFVLFPAQREWVEWVFTQWLAKEDILSDKSRDMGLSWLAIELACTLALFWDGFRAGFGSRKEEYVDKTAEPKSLFWKARFFLRNVPAEFRGGWNERIHAPHMRLLFPDTNASISGESGDGIGRGDRVSMYIVDEAAHLERPQLIEEALSATTDFRLDISSAKGMGNPFAVKRHSWPAHRVRTMHWKLDPRKNDAWYLKQKLRLDPVTLAQEIDIDYTASVTGIVIPGLWVRAAVDAHVKLGLTPSGMRLGALDVADEGADKNAFCGAHGFLIEILAEWSGSGSDIAETTQKTFDLCDAGGFDCFLYDGDGLGAGVRGDARVINERRALIPHDGIDVVAFRGSAAVLDPEAEDVEGRKNQDYFGNLKAQGWWRLRKRFGLTYAAITALESGLPQDPDFDPDEIISLPALLPELQRLIGELSQPTYTLNGAGKIIINKAPKGTRSPNLADSVMIRFSGVMPKQVVVTDALLKWARGQKRR